MDIWINSAPDTVGSTCELWNVSRYQRNATQEISLFEAISRLIMMKLMEGKELSRSIIHVNAGCSSARVMNAIQMAKDLGIEVKLDAY